MTKYKKVKIHRDAFDAILTGLGPIPFALYFYAVAHCSKAGRVQLNGIIVSAILGLNPDCDYSDFEKALQDLKENGLIYSTEHPYYYTVNHV